MTFDFTPGWLDSLINSTEFASPKPCPVLTSGVRPGIAPAPAAPAHPTIDQMAMLVGELFTEGSLSFEQLCSLSNVPELTPLLGDTVAGVVPSRRLAAAKRR